MSVVYTVPPSNLAWLERIPTDRCVAMLIRHSVRDPLPGGPEEYVLPITPVGRAIAEELGQHLAARLRSVHASPLVRTMQTGECLAAGAGLDATPQPDKLLGDPGVFVVDDRAGDTWSELGHEEVMRHLVEEPQPLPGCAAPDAAARFLAHHILALAQEPGVHAFVTHDSVLAAATSRLLGVPLGSTDWPWFLEAAFFWLEGDAVMTGYRAYESGRSVPLVQLTEEDVVGFARREVARTVGLDCRARFFLAGGAFKTLLTGRAPSDLDLWAPTPADREVLRRHLIDRGASLLPPKPYTEAFELAGRIVELPLKAEPATLEERLQRFDLGLSAVGVEHTPADRWRCVIDPRALESVRRSEVLLLDDLPNWKHALTMLERARRYASELGYSLPRGEEERLWRIYAEQDAGMRGQMVDRFNLASRGDQGVAEELACRFP